MRYRDIARRLVILEHQAQERAARQPPVREIVLCVPAADVDTPQAALAAATPYTLWTAPGVEATYPRWVDPYYEGRDIT